mmetsp:Transcript_68575/g.61607  ORF Transcript_68575/g.61607 Transcript_68575/m.61607 type:complete len:139 (-) Transcript_68575:230-646(-)
MGKCLSTGSHVYEKVSKKEVQNEQQPDLKHMDVSTIYLGSDIYTTTDGWFHHGDNAENPRAKAINLYEIQSLTPKYSSGSFMISPLAMTRMTSDQIQLINLYILDIQSSLSEKYKDTEYRTEFAIIPNKIHHIISSYW